MALLDEKRNLEAACINASGAIPPNRTRLVTRAKESTGEASVKERKTDTRSESINERKKRVCVC